MQKGLFRNVYEHFVKNVQAFLSLLYLLMVGIGMLFNYHKYAEFGINIFQYADIFDFLIAPFDDFRIILFGVLSTVVPIFLMWFDNILKKHKPKIYALMNMNWDKKPWYGVYRSISFSMLFIGYIYGSSALYGEYTRRRILEEPPISIKYVDDQVESGIQIGQTKEILFLLKEKQVLAIPLTSLVKEIKIKTLAVD